ncbi:MAG: hypothetical protein K0Q66_1640 [Chitinophagaceae bacterium]|nr:hypothetical protein [Chitinophagaceae bacterium]
MRKGDRDRSAGSGLVVRLDGSFDSPGVVVTLRVREYRVCFVSNIKLAYICVASCINN